MLYKYGERTRNLWKCFGSAFIFILFQLSLFGGVLIKQLFHSCMLDLR